MPHSNTREFRVVLFGLAFAACLAAEPVMAGSQSSNSSSNCSNGRCSRVDSLTIDDGRGRIRSWRHVESWEQRRGRSYRIPRAYRGRDDDD